MNIRIFSFIKPKELKKLSDYNTELYKIWNNEFIGLPHEVIPNFMDWEIEDNCRIWFSFIKEELNRKNIPLQKLYNFIDNYCSNPKILNYLFQEGAYCSIYYQGVNDINEIVFRVNYIEKFNLTDILITVPVNFFEFCTILEKDCRYTLKVDNRSLEERYSKLELQNKKEEYLQKNKNIQEQLKNSEYNNFLKEYKKSLKELNS